MELLTTCSSRMRPKLCARMLESFYKTKTGDSDIFIYVDEADPFVDEYKSVLSGVNHEISFHRYMCHVLNYASCIKYPGLKYYSEANDDHVFVTEGWDTQMMDSLEAHGGWGIAYGYTQNMPTAIMMSGNIIETLGYWMFPEFEHLACDRYIEDLIHELNFGVKMPHIMIDHRHHYFGKAEMDDNYKWVYSKEQKTIGFAAYDKWKATKRDEDVNKLKEAIKKSKEGVFDIKHAGNISSIKDY